MVETHFYDSAIEPMRKVVENLDVAGEFAKRQLERPEVKEVRTKKCQVGDEVEIEGRTLRATDAGWRRVDPNDPAKTHELTPLERRVLVGA